MKVELKDLSPVKKQMSVEVEAEEVDLEIKGIVREYRKKARIPGFRQGKAPVSMIQTRFAREIEEDARERLVSRFFTQATRDKGLRPLADPALEDMSHEAGQPLTFKTTFEVLPEFEPQGYRDIEVQRTESEVTDKDVDEALESLRQSRATLEVEEGRKAAEGDVVFADVSGTPSSGDPFHRERMAIEVGAKKNLPAFNEHLAGAAAGDEVSFVVEYPQDYQAKELAGAKVEYSLVIHEVKRRSVPKLDDEFAKDLGDLDDLAALTTRVREDLVGRRRAEADEATRRAVIDKVLMQNPIVLPDVLVEREVAHRLEEFVRQMMMQGVDPQKAEIDWVDLRKHHEAPARKSVHARLLLDAVARVEKIRVEDDAIDQRIEKDAERLGESPRKLRETLKKNHGREALVTQMVRERVLDYLTSVANIR